MREADVVFAYCSAFRSHGDSPLLSDFSVTYGHTSPDRARSHHQTAPDLTTSPHVSPRLTRYLAHISRRCGTRLREGAVVVTQPC